MKRVAALCVVVVAGVAFARADTGDALTSFSFAFVGDIPYSSTDVRRMPEVTDHINAHDVEFVAHAGDIKASSIKCTDSVIRARFEMFQAFEGAFWFTPGDNEWTDCRDADPDADPLERLDFLRSVFYPVPSRTTGGSPIAVTSQSSPYVENVVFRLGCVTFGSIHQVGSNNGMSSWPDETTFERERREAEVANRLAANATWVDRVFADAEAAGSRGVFLMMQAKPLTTSYWGDVTDRIIAGARGFDGPVLVAHGDGHSHQVEADFLGLGNVTRWQTGGGSGATDEWIRAHVDCGDPSVFSQHVIQTGDPVPSTTTSSPPSSTSTTTPPTTSSTIAPSVTMTTLLDMVAGATVDRQAVRDGQVHFPNLP